MLGSDVSTILKAAVDAGFSIIPINSDKRPRLATWKPYQERLPTRDELNTWWGENPAAWGVVTGSVSGIIVLDFDGAAGMETLRKLNLRPHVRTGSGGAHLYLHHPGWKIATVNGRSKQELGRRYPGVDVRGDRGYAILAGHNQSGCYEWIRPMEPDSVDVLPEDLREFLGLLHPPSPEPPQSNGNGHSAVNGSGKVQPEKLIRHAIDLVHSGRGRNDAGFLLAVQLRDNGFPESEAEGVMRSYVSQVPTTNLKGKHETYTAIEALHSLKQAFTRSPREPWAVGNAGGPRPPRNGHQQPDVQPPQLPIVVVNNRELRHVSGDAVAALQNANDPPRLFVRSGNIVHVVCDEAGRQSISDASEAFLRGRMTRSADFRRLVHDKNRNPQYPATNPPIDVVRDVLALAPTNWGFPALESVTESPLLRPDGSVLSTPGYDSMTRVYYAPSPSLRFPEMAAEPSAREVDEARVLLDEAMEGFPFVDAASRANAYAMLLTPIIRRAISGNVPVALVDAPQAGTGKSLLAEIVALVHTGSDAAMQPSPARGDESEWRKMLGAVLSNGNALVIFDNVDHRLHSASLALAVTASTWTDRILGLSKTITLPVRCTWIVTGNNLQLSGDLPRRCYWIRLDAGTSQPWQRSGFRHPNLKQWVKQNRGRILAALLTIARAWFVAGKPEAATPNLGSFESWAATVGGILSHAGIAGFLNNLDSLYQESDPSQLQWEGFLQSLLGVFGKDSFTIKELVELMPTRLELSQVVPDELADEERKGSMQRRLGRAFSERVGRRYGAAGLHLAKAGMNRNKVVLWRVAGSEPACNRDGCE